MRGQFITLEGLEGVGKSTQIDHIFRWLTERDVQCIKTREPGGTPFAESVRQLLLDPNLETPCSDTELLLMFASRAQHIDRVIEPALSAGQWVVCSRFSDSTFAYQGGGRGVDTQRIEALSEWINLTPDLTILLDCDPLVGLQRAQARGQLDRLEREEVGFFQRAREAYLALAEQHDRIAVIDAIQDEEAVFEQICTHLEAHFFA